MPIIATHELKSHEPIPHREEVYNALDCCLTLEIFEELSSRHNQPPLAYDFHRALQAPALEMMLRGWKVDQDERCEGTAREEAKAQAIYEILQEFAIAVWDKGLNPDSPKQLQDFFYTHMGLPVVYKFEKGSKRITTNRDALESLQAYFHTQPIINCILGYKDIAGLLKVLNKEIDSDGRWRQSINIAGTETFRWSSSASSEGTGSNTQNITPNLRRMFVADNGFTLFGIDLEQAEAREIAWMCWILFNDCSYLDAVESGDLHTYTARLVWPELPWTGDIRKDRAIAEQPHYRHFSRRDNTKKVGHASNLVGKPFTISKHTHIPVKLVAAFQDRYFEAFPCIQRYHRWCAEQLQTVQYIENAFGVGRHFFGRPNDDATLREAVAFIPQSMTALRCNLGIWRLWKYLPEIQLLAQGHDAAYGQCPQSLQNELLPKALSLMSTPMTHNNRTFDVPGDLKTGNNWAPAHMEHNTQCSPNCRLNPNGLKKWRLS